MTKGKIQSETHGIDLARKCSGRSGSVNKHKLVCNVCSGS